MDRRAKRVQVAEAGHQLLKRMTQAENLFNERTLGGLSAADRQTMIRALTVVKQALSSQGSVATGVEDPHICN